MKDDAKVRRGTYLNHGQAAANDELGGRFAVLNKPLVSGNEAATKYPCLPEGNPWSGTVDMGAEPFTGYAIDQQEPTGEAFEIAQSIEKTSSPCGIQGDDEAAPLVQPPICSGAANLKRSKRRL